MEKSKLLIPSSARCARYAWGQNLFRMILFRQTLFGQKIFFRRPQDYANFKLNFYSDLIFTLLIVAEMIFIFVRKFNLSEIIVAEMKICEMNDAEMISSEMIFCRNECHRVDICRDEA
jgi:hypothetical protein